MLKLENNLFFIKILKYSFTQYFYENLERCKQQTLREGFYIHKTNLIFSYLLVTILK
jgi:hypothetical protein